MRTAVPVDTPRTLPGGEPLGDGEGVPRSDSRPAPGAGVADWLLDALVAPGFSRAGHPIRRRWQRWVDPARMDGRTWVVTGASSGIGRAVALGLAHLGASLVLIGRDQERTAATAEDVAATAARNGDVVSTIAEVLDLTEPRQLIDFAGRFRAREQRLDGIVHNAGALRREYGRAPDGHELTVATHVLAPFRLTLMLSPLLRRTGGTLVTVSSGGMYLEPLDLTGLEVASDAYDGRRAYARAKRAQVALAHEWARRWRGDGVASYAMHPGWVDTPGLASGLPGFARLGPLLRKPEQGADTAVWLAAGGARLPTDGTPPVLDGFFHDRHRRPEHRLRRTRLEPGEESRRGAALWEWCLARSRWAEPEPEPESQPRPQLRSELQARLGAPSGCGPEECR